MAAFSGVVTISAVAVVMSLSDDMSPNVQITPQGITVTAKQSFHDEVRSCLTPHQENACRKKKKKV